MRRYAIYYAPRSNLPLAQFARSWLGRDPESGALCRQPDLSNITSSRLAELTADPRHYGFHGTLKPPFTLAPGTSHDDFMAAVSAFAAAQPAIQLGGISLEQIGRFVALVPSSPSTALNDLAADSVKDFDHFRASPSSEDLARRRAAGLSPRQDAYLVRWGYPYVLEEFRFHLTLTGSLDEPERAMLTRILDDMTAPFRAAPLRIEDLVIFTQEERTAPFRVSARIPLAGN